MSHEGRTSRNFDRNASAAADEAEPARGEQRRWRSFGTVSIQSSPWAERSSKRPDDGLGIGDDRDILHREIDRGAMPRGVHRRAAILGHDHEVTLIGAGARG